MLAVNTLAPEVGRDHAAITRSIHLGVRYDQPEVTWTAIDGASTPASSTSASRSRAPYPADVARWIVRELIVG